MENRFVVIEGNLEDKMVLRIARSLLLFSLKGQVNRPEREYAFLHYMDFTRQLYSIGNILDSVFLRYRTTDSIDLRT